VTEIYGSPDVLADDMPRMNPTVPFKNLCDLMHCCWNLEMATFNVQRIDGASAVGRKEYAYKESANSWVFEMEDSTLP
jgi:hypothetical protein